MRKCLGALPPRRFRIHTTLKGHESELLALLLVQLADISIDDDALVCLSKRFFTVSPSTPQVRTVSTLTEMHEQHEYEETQAHIAHGVDVVTRIDRVLICAVTNALLDDIVLALLQPGDRPRDAEDEGDEKHDLQRLRVV